MQGVAFVNVHDAISAHHHRCRKVEIALRRAPVESRSSRCVSSCRACSTPVARHSSTYSQAWGRAMSLVISLSSQKNCSIATSTSCRKRRNLQSTCRRVRCVDRRNRSQHESGRLAMRSLSQRRTVGIRRVVARLAMLLLKSGFQGTTTAS
jgi:hypothetical protein